MNQDSRRSLPAFIVLSPKDIAVRAYEIYLERGASDGLDGDDWFRAERELKARGKDPDRSEDQNSRRSADRHFGSNHRTA
jgi:Protein of unknown function (DUF2934)